MNAHERTLLQHHAFRHERMLRDAELHRALRERRAPGLVRRSRFAAAAALRGLAARLEPRGHGRLA